MRAWTSRRRSTPRSPCAPTATDCTPILLDVEITTGTGCAEIRVVDGEDGTVLAGPFNATLDASGNLRGFVATLDLTIPYTTDTGSSVDIDLTVSNVIMTGTISGSDLSNVVIGGFLVKDDFEGTLMTLVPLISDSITYDDVAGILANLYDVEVGGGCNGLSVGLTAEGSVAP